jgi:hypothetical protein
MQSITKLVRDSHCNGIVMVAVERREVLLRTHELKQLLMEPPASLVLIRLPAQPQKARAFYLGAGFLSWLRRLWRYRVDAGPVENVLEAEHIS